MAGIDLVTAKKVEKQVERGTRLKRLREREDSDIARLTERAEIPSQSSSSSSSPVSTTSSPARGSRSQRKKLKQSPSISVKGILTSFQLGSEKLSVRQSNVNVCSYRSSFWEWTLGVWRSRRAGPSSTELRGESKPLRRSWKLRNQEIPERLVLLLGRKTPPGPSLAIRRTAIAVLLTGKINAFLLGSRQARIRLAETLAAVVLKEVERSGRQGQDHAFCFDTTASNTGMVQGPLKFGLSKNSTKLALVGLPPSCPQGDPMDVFEASLGSSSGPDLEIFKRPRDRRSFVDSSQRETVETSGGPRRVFRHQGTLPAS
ncbi:hypothetical protein GWK47_002265 [Chionoecetes opilio]|uniref:Uncharacterized protein n=1 Tax=Chionoecetes opilio TaxID=41210 RepID=A0A8J5CIC8_CHIOP|nr:hypothetical protein GWK47_002265 [Chionoecetes opilio]